MARLIALITLAILTVAALAVAGALYWATMALLERVP